MSSTATSARSGIALVLVSQLLASVAQAQDRNSSDQRLGRLEAEITRLAAAADGTVGVAALHLESGRAVYLNRDEPFPMASSYKVPIAVQLLTRVDQAQLRLDSMIALQPGDLHPGSGTLAELFDDPGVVLSVRNLLELMLLISDNSATDVVLRLAGGPQAVTKRMRELGVAGVRVDRPTIELISNWIGLRQVPVGAAVPIDAWRSAVRAVPADSQRVAAAAFNDDPRDTATPAEMALLLQKIWRGEALSPANTSLLLDIMRRSTTGAARLKGMLPPNTTVAHKTGTIGGTTNDIGIITLPEDAGTVIVVAFVKGSARPIDTRERAIAQMARAIYDFFLFSS